MQDKRNVHDREDTVLDLAKTAEMRVTLFTTLAGITAFLAFRSDPILLWQTPVFLIMVTVAAWVEKDCAIWLERRSNREIRSRQDTKWKQKWEKNILRPRSLSLLCFAGAILLFIPVIWHHR